MDCGVYSHSDVKGKLETKLPNGQTIKNKQKMKKKNLLMTAIAIFGLATITNAQVPSYVPTIGLQGYWPFNGNANDESANTNDGTVNGATLVPDRFSNSNSAYAFDGISSYIEVPDNSNLRLNNTDFTINFWMNVNSFNSVGTAIIYKRGNLSANGWAINCNSDDGNALEYTVSSGNDPQENSSTIPTLGLWQNITIVYSLSNQRISFYFNGVMDPANSTIIPTPNGNCNSVLRFGYDTYSPPNDYWLNGTLDDIGIWDRALTQQEITNLYNANTVGIMENIQSNLFSVFPNPAQRIINVKADNKLFGENYSIYDNTGRVVLTGKLNSPNTTIELGNLSGGVYMFSVGENLKQTFKVIKE